MMKALYKQLSLAGGEMGLIVPLEKRKGKGTGMSGGGFRGIKAGVSSQPFQSQGISAPSHPSLSQRWKGAGMGWEHQNPA